MDPSSSGLRPRWQEGPGRGDGRSRTLRVPGPESRRPSTPVGVGPTSSGHTVSPRPCVSRFLHPSGVSRVTGPLLGSPRPCHSHSRTPTPFLGPTWVETGWGSQVVNPETERLSEPRVTTCLTIYGQRPCRDQLPQHRDFHRRDQPLPLAFSSSLGRPYRPGSGSPGGTRPVDRSRVGSRGRSTSGPLTSWRGGDGVGGGEPEVTGVCRRTMEEGL